MLVTGFEPFGGSPLNPSAMVLPRLSPPLGWRLATRVLPVETFQLSDILDRLLDEVKPTLVLSLGEARGSSAFRVETTGRNRLNFRLPDNAGQRLADVPVLAGGPAELPATIAVTVVRDRLRALDLQADLSHDAGGFLCNQLLYSLCHRFASSSTPVGFLHLPSMPEQGFGPGLGLDRQVLAVRSVLDLLTAEPSSERSGE